MTIVLRPPWYTQETSHCSPLQFWSIMQTFGFRYLPAKKIGEQSRQAERFNKKSYVQVARQMQRWQVGDWMGIDMNIDDGKSMWVQDCLVGWLRGIPMFDRIQEMILFLWGGQCTTEVFRGWLGPHFVIGREDCTWEDHEGLWYVSILFPFDSEIISIDCFRHETYLVEMLWRNDANKRMA